MFKHHISAVLNMQDETLIVNCHRLEMVLVSLFPQMWTS